MLEFPRWKYALVAIVMLLALIFALPNFSALIWPCRWRARIASPWTMRRANRSRLC